MHAPTRIELDVDLPFRELFWAMLRMSVSATRYLLGFFGLAVLIYLTLRLYQALPTPEWEPAEYITSLLEPIVIGSGVVIVLLPFLAVLRTRRVLRAEGMHGHRHYVFTPEDISVESPLANAKVKWPAYIRAHETRSVFLLYSAASFANVLPKRCFANEAEIAAFRDLVRQKIPKTRFSH